MTAHFANPGICETVKLLLVGNNPAVAVRVQGLLDDISSDRFEAVHAQGLADALIRLDMEEFRAVLLVLSDGAEGPDNLAKISQHVSAVPVVVISNEKSDKQWTKIPKGSLQGFLSDSDLTSAMLESALRTALQIHALRRELKEARQREHHERRMRLLERLSGAPQSVVTTHNRGGEPLKETSFEKFTALSCQYGEVLEMTLAKNASAKVVSDRLRAISEELGAIKAGPNDLLDIHGHALRLKSCGVSERQADICAEESRLMLIEAMGYLTSYYRNYSNYALSIINSMSPAEAPRRVPRAKVATLRPAG